MTIRPLTCRRGRGLALALFFVVGCSGGSSGGEGDRPAAGPQIALAEVDAALVEKRLRDRGKKVDAQSPIAPTASTPGMQSWIVDDVGAVILLTFGSESGPQHAYTIGDRAHIEIVSMHPEGDAKAQLTELLADTPIDELDAKKLRKFFSAREFELEVDEDREMGETTVELSGKDGLDYNLGLTRRLPGVASAHDDRRLLTVEVGAKGANRKLLDDILAGS